MHGMQGERIRQAFAKFDKDGDGYIDPDDFKTIIEETAGHKLSDHLLNNLHTLCNIGQTSRVSYANVRAFQNVIREMDLVELVVKNATGKSKDARITRTDFLNEAARITRSVMFTPMEADILFHFAGLDEPSGKLTEKDFSKVTDSSWRSGFDFVSEASKNNAFSQVAAKTHATTSTFLSDLLHSAHHFALGSIAGAFGAFMVYPIDLVKTRMQNQRSGRIGQRLYDNSIDCARKVVRNEGFRGLYSGVLPQLVGVAPEKAIKLTVNDLVRGKFSDPKTGAILYKHELLAGGSAGACQVIFTNPLEIVKIRLQIQGEMAKQGNAPKRSAMWIVRNLGLVGLYKGASACLLRDGKLVFFITLPHFLHIDLTYYSTILRNLLPSVQPPQARLFRRITYPKARRPSAPHSRCYRRYARRLPHDPLRRHQDPITSRGAQGRTSLHLSPPLCQDRLRTRGFPRILQRWPCTYHAQFSAIRFHIGRI
jgi:solute carrier family 25 aspartate/glutamate transporter 12/13